MMIRLTAVFISAYVGFCAIQVEHVIFNVGL